MSSTIDVGDSDDPLNKEQLLHIINQFLDAAHNKRLHLSVSASHHTKFCEIIGGDLHIVWQEISNARAAKMVDSFMEDIDLLVSQYFAPTLYQDQLEYLHTAMKPFQMTCKQLGSRLCVISHLGRYLPGSIVGDICFDLFFTEDTLKHAYFSLMPSPWKIKFAESGQILNDVNCTCQNLIHFMAIQEALSKRSQRDQLN